MFFYPVIKELLGPGTACLSLLYWRNRWIALKGGCTIIGREAGHVRFLW